MLCVNTQVLHLVLCERHRRINVPKAQILQKTVSLSRALLDIWMDEWAVSSIVQNRTGYSLDWPFNGVGGTYIAFTNVHICWVPTKVCRHTLDYSSCVVALSKFHPLRLLELLLRPTQQATNDLTWSSFPFVFTLRISEHSNKFLMNCDFWLAHSWTSLRSLRPITCVNFIFRLWLPFFFSKDTFYAKYFLNVHLLPANSYCDHVISSSLPCFPRGHPCFHTILIACDRDCNFISGI